MHLFYVIVLRIYYKFMLMINASCEIVCLLFSAFLCAMQYAILMIERIKCWDGDIWSISLSEEK